eukprot:TRINITY_DN17192_c0_g1_i3.p1 TRINITY_DN17192_c0_g1~~TRINITY_DN17192_c0_g1_i3.p1  ORF type:complete len:139 (-),score=24.96 TRINITY_DN17192_c0_g1_i3:149-565(-)
MGCAVSDLSADMMESAAKPDPALFEKSWQLAAQCDQSWDLATDEDGFNLLQVASRSGNAAIVEMVLAGSRDLDANARRSLYNKGGADGTAAVALAADRGHVQVVELLLAAPVRTSAAICASLMPVSYTHLTLPTKRIV